MKRSIISEVWKRRWLLSVGALVLGLLVGFVGKRVVGSEDGDVGETVEDAQYIRKSARGGAAVAVSTLRSRDTIEEIVADRSVAQYGRLALWVLDASSEEMEAMFRRLSSAANVEGSMFELLFVQWMQVDPRAAIEAAAGTERESTAWWAWGKCDPARALAVAAREEPRWLGTVMRGAGQTHPDLALDLLEQYPELAHHASAIDGIVEGLQQRDPREAVEYARRHGWEASDQIREWARRDPESFLRWCAAQPATLGLSASVRDGLNDMVRDYPERSERLLATLPIGQLRRELLQTAVEGLVARDLEGALALAERFSSGRVQSALYGRLGAALTGVDVARSMELFREIGHLHQIGTEFSTVYPTGEATSGAYGSFQGWVRSLAMQQPQETMGLVREVREAASLEETVGEVWVQVDAREFAEWLLSEAPGVRRDGHARRLSQHLLALEDPDLESATEWAASIEAASVRERAMSDVLQRGWRANASVEEAERYFHSEDTLPTVREAWERWRSMNPASWQRWQVADDQR